ncbi:unnamed protein product, partial [Brassica oleracea]
SLPEDVIVDILARVRICYYPTLSLVSKQFRSVVASRELYSRRSLLACTEHCLYIVLYDRKTKLNRWYILHQKANGKRSLVLIPSLPTLTRYEICVAVGSKIYVFVGNTPSAYSIDCRSHTVQPLPSSPVPMSNRIADVIDEKIYVMGCMDDFKNGIMLFNTKTQIKVSARACIMKCKAGKMYVRDLLSGSVYDPKENIWRWDMQELKWESACVVGDVLYYHDHPIVRTYDPKLRCWEVVKGLEELLSEMFSFWHVHTGNYGGNLVLFSAKAICKDRIDVKYPTKEIWCAEISLERRQGGEVWGKVEWCGQVL